MSRFFIFLSIIIWAIGAGEPLLASAQRERCLSVGELNCENLFDTIHAPCMADAEFTPDGARYWGTRRFRRKLNLLARELASMDPPYMPEIVALLEVENESVLRDLTRHTRLASLGYRYLIGNGADPRGINTALIYLQGSFRPLRTFQLLGAAEQKATGLSTRSILGVEGVTRTGDTLHILVVHAPSKVGGMAAEKKRAIVFRALRHYTDSLLACPPYPHVIILGDFNETATSAAIRQQLGALAPTKHPQPQRLYDMAQHANAINGAKGTYCYRGNWQMLDHCVLSGTLLQSGRTAAQISGRQPKDKDRKPRNTDCETQNTDCETQGNNSEPQKNSLYADESSLIIVDHNFLMEADKTYGGMKPWRTYVGDYYKGGFSDHLPLLLRLYRR